ncbi:MAG: Flp pilus assembly protein CpaB [Phycisphaerales bacterium]|nr:Flp pilus assembly protein CpaB [Phycisphaerales bacterium]
MNVKTIAPLGLAAILGLAAALVARNMLANRPVATAGDESTLRTVVVASTNIMPGTEIDPTMLITAKVSAEMAPEGSFVDPGELHGRVPQAPIYKGQPIINAVLAPKGSVGGLQALVPPGMRAITLQVDEFSGVGGFLTPGCRVDVIATMQGEKQGDMTARTIVQNILVTAVGQRMTLAKPNGEPEPPMRSVTLIATPEEAQAIELAASTGRPRLVLRNVRDDSRDRPAAVSLSDFASGETARSGDPFASLGRSPIEIPLSPVQATSPVSVTSPEFEPSGDPAGATRTWSVKIIRAGNESEVQFTLPPQPAGRNPAPRRDGPITQTEHTPLGK